MKKVNNFRLISEESVVPYKSTTLPEHHFSLLPSFGGASSELPLSTGETGLALAG